MHRRPPPPIRFRSVLAPLMEKYLLEKQALGYRYYPGSVWLRMLDRFLSEQSLGATELPQTLVERWTAKRPNESWRTHKYRIGLARHFAMFMVRHGCRAYVPDSRVAAVGKSTFVPHVFTHAEVRQLLTAVDRLGSEDRASFRRLVMPEIFRVLYGCGLRVGEALRLTVADVDLVDGVLRIRQTKFGKDRLVPMAPSLVARLRKYAETLGSRPAEAAFFPAPDGGPYSQRWVYTLFRRFLWQCGIPHGGRSRGPRVHDFRHTFAVHRLMRWYQEGADLSAKLAFLAAYLGHVKIAFTQHYLHLTTALMPEITARVGRTFGHLIPWRAES